MKVLVIGGGISNEREVSLRSAAAVADAAKENHEVEFYDWDGSRQWLAENVSNFDVVLPILHGTGGEDGVIQAILEELGVLYLGSDSTASRLCFNKQSTLDLLEKNGVTIPVSKLVNKDEYLNSPLVGEPHVLKPFDSGSSVDTFIYPSIPSIDYDAVDAAFQRHSKMLLEEFVSGVEISVPVLEGKELEIIEIVPPEGGVFDYENKYNGQSKELVPAVNVSEEMQLSAKKLGRKVHELTGCKHLSRVDMIVSENKLYVLETNTMPGMTDQSLFPKAAAALGMNFTEFVDYLITLAYGGGSV